MDISAIGNQFNYYSYKASYELLIKSFPIYENLAYCDDVDITGELVALFERFIAIHRAISDTVLRTIEKDKNRKFKEETAIEAIKAYLDFGNDSELTNVKLNLFPMDIRHKNNTSYINDVIHNTLIEMGTRSTLANWSFEDTESLLDFVKPDLISSIIEKYTAVEKPDKIITYINSWKDRKENWYEVLKDRLYDKDNTIEGIARCFIALYDTHLLNEFTQIFISLEDLTRRIRNYIRYDGDKFVFNRAKCTKLIGHLSFIISMDLSILYCAERAYVYFETIPYEWNAAATNVANIILNRG